MPKRKHTVKLGDTFSAIAKLYDIPLDSLLAWNNIKDPNKLSLGQELLLDAPGPYPLKLSGNLFLNMDAMYLYMTSNLKLSPEAASSILGNVMQESSFLPNLVSKTGATGFYLLLGRKKKKYDEFLKTGWKVGPKSETLFVYDYITNNPDYYYQTYDNLKLRQANGWKERTADGTGWYKARNEEGLSIDSLKFYKDFYPREKAQRLPTRKEDLLDAWKNSKDINKLTEMFMNYWELPALEEENLPKRQLNAYEIYTYYSNLKQGGSMNYLDYLKDGSKIHIKKSHEGKFTEYCGGKVTEECVRKGKNSPSAKVRKQATFAANARKWEH